MQPEINYTMVGQRIRTARLQKKLSQAELGSLVGCSNNHISHIETAQTKVSLSMLSKLALALNQDLDYFLLDTQYAKRDRLIDEEIAEKLSRCNTSTLLTVNQIICIHRQFLPLPAPLLFLHLEIISSFDRPQK